MEQNDFQQLIYHCHEMAEKLLIQQNGEFYPFGALIKNHGELKHIAHYDGDEFPLSQTLINGLRTFFENEMANKKIKAYAISFDCKAKKDENSEKTDAIAIECHSRENGQNTIYYFPYIRSSVDKLNFGEPWGLMID